MEYKTYTLTMEVRVFVKQDAKEVTAYDGTVTGFELPGDIIVKPWVVFEKCSKDDHDTEDLTTDQLAELGVIYEYDNSEFVEQEEEAQ